MKCMLTSQASDLAIAGPAGVMLPSVSYGHKLLMDVILLTRHT